MLSTLITKRSESTTARQPAGWFSDYWGGTKQAGVRVGPESALALPAYFAGIKVIAEDVAKLPHPVYRRLKPRGKERDPDHPHYSLLHDRWNPTTTSYFGRETVTKWAIGWGNGFAELEPRVDGYVSRIWPIHPSRVKLVVRSGEPLRYKVWQSGSKVTAQPGQRMPVFGSGGTGRWVTIPAERMLHVRGLGDGLVGLSPAQVMAKALAVGMAAQEFTAKFFADGMMHAGIFEYPGVLEDEEYENLKESWPKGLPNAFDPLFLENGMTFKDISLVPAKDAQLLESRKFSVLDVARILRIAPHKIGDLDRATFSNIEHQEISHVTGCLMPWFVRWDSEINLKLFADDPDFFAEHLILGLLRGDQQSRATYFNTRFRIGTLSPNDIRELENENPIGPEGDRYFIEQGLQPLDGNFSGSSGGEDGNVAGALRPVLLSTAARLLRKEHKASEQALDRHGGRFTAEFHKWEAEFFRRHEQQLCESLEIPARSAASLLHKSVDVRIIVQDAVAGEMLEHRRGTKVPIEERARVLTDIILERIAA